MQDENILQPFWFVESVTVATALWRATMAPYDVYIFCDHCNDSHRMDISIGLHDGPYWGRLILDSRGVDVRSVSTEAIPCPTP